MIRWYQQVCVRAADSCAVSTEPKLPFQVSLWAGYGCYRVSFGAAGCFIFQIASFSNIEGAVFTQKKYDGLDGYKTIIKDIPGERTAFKVWIKGFQSEAEARDYSANGKFRGAFIVKE